MTIQITVLAHNEERRIAACLESLPLAEEGIAVAVVVNGSTDGTADIVRGYASRGVRLVEYAEGGKARSWNRFMLDETPEADAYVFVDGDARLLPGTVRALERCLQANPRANAAAGMPRNGRRAAYYRQLLVEEHGLFGDCYALSGEFVRRMRASGLRLPDDLVGDDSLIAALANNDLGRDADRREDAVVPCQVGGFLCEPTPPTPGGARLQARRMVNYSVRHFQNRIISALMQGEGPAALPQRMADLYPEWLPRLRPRFSPLWFAFDRRALARMRGAA
jgi:glycosyltransferase involved in cell wall biosynthesis